MDPRLVRAKVQKSILQRMKKEKRRIRNKGESALNTAKMREINEDIEANLKFWIKNLILIFSLKKIYLDLNYIKI